MFVQLKLNKDAQSKCIGGGSINVQLISYIQFFIFSALCCYLVLAAPVEKEEKPDPYSFSFEESNEDGTQMTRQESGNEQGVVQGSYSYIDANGITRIVNYIADDDGFRASISSNEPGVITSEPASVQYSVQ